MFRAENRIVRFEIALPQWDHFAVSQKGRERSEVQQRKAVEQAERQRWRALFLVIKAKLESVEQDIASFEEEFLAHIVMPDNKTVAQHILPNVAAAYESGRMQRLLPAKVG